MSAVAADMAEELRAGETDKLSFKTPGKRKPPRRRSRAIKR